MIQIARPLVAPKGPPALEVVQFERRFRTFARPFEGRAVDPAGREYHVCIKPQIRGALGLNIALFAEWCGYVLAERLGVPVPRHHLIRITQEFVDSTGGELGDVRAGLAFGSEWQEDSSPATLFVPAPRETSNPESVAGVSVLDTLQQNTDRHSDNVLVVPVSPGGVGKYRLCYIDNGWLPLIGDWYADHLGFRSCVPADEEVRRVVQTVEDFTVFVFAAETLDVRRLAADLLTAPYQEWDVSRGRVLRTAVRALRRGAVLRSLLAGSMNSFPLLHSSGRGGTP